MSEQFSREWFRETLAKREPDPPARCSVHPKSKSVARFVDELTGVRVDACKRCRTKYQSLAGWREER